MKPTSIIFIAIALIIIFVGGRICAGAEARAEKEGIDIFGQTLDDENNSVYKFTFGADNVYNKIELVLDEADVYIYGGFSEPYMELYNFDDGSYAMTTTNRNITVNTSFDIMSIVKFWESGFSFDGLRGYLKETEKTETVMPKRVDIYLPTDGDVNVINVTLDNGSLHVSNLDTAIDFSVNLGEGDAVFTSVNTSSYIKSDIKKGYLYLNGVTAGTMTATMTEGDVNAENFNFKNISITGVKTNVSVTTSNTLDFFDTYLSARQGKITLNGEDRGTEYDSKYSSANDATVIITVTDGNIIMAQAEANPEPAPDSGSDTSGATDGTNTQ